jgi:hypothetical protein
MRPGVRKLLDKADPMDALTDHPSSTPKCRFRIFGEAVSM